MQLLRLQMRNFKRYRNQDVIFRDGITGILGNNGTGKSTIVDAILFCLYGVKETGLDFILSASAGRLERAEVRLDFSVRGEEFQMVRSLGPKKRHDAQLHRGGRLMAKGVSEVQDAIKKVFRMGHADFRNTIFSGQKELLTLVAATPEERKRWFRRVLGIDTLKDEGGEILREEVRVAREKLLLIQGRLEDVRREELEDKCREVERKIGEIDGEILRLEGERSTLDSRWTTLESELRALLEREKRDFSTRNEIKRREQEMGEIRKDRAGVASEMEALSRDREEFDELATTEGAFEPLRERHTASVKQFHAFQSLTEREEERRARAREVEDELRHLDEEDARMDRDEERVEALAPARARWEEVRARLARLREVEERSRTHAEGIAKKEVAIAELARRGGVLRSRIGQIKEARTLLEDLGERAGLPPGSSEDPMQALEEHHLGLFRTMAEREAALEHARGNRERLRAALAIIEAQGPDGTCPTCRQPLGNRHRDLMAEMREEVEGMDREMVSREGDLTTARRDLDALEAILDEARNLMATCKNLGEVSDEWEDVQERILVEISGREHLEKELLTLDYDPRERQALERELSDLEDPLRESAIIADRLQGRQALLLRIRDYRARLRKLGEECEAISREKAELGFDPAMHRQLEEEFRRLEERHRRYLKLRPEMDRLQFLKEQATDLKSREERVERTITGLYEALKGIGFSRDELERVNGDQKDVERQSLEVTRHLEGFRVEGSHLETERDRLNGVLERLDREKEQYDRLNEEIRLLELTRGYLNSFTDHLLGVVRDQVQEETGRILSEITDGRYDTVIIDDAFQLLVHDLGGDYPVNRFSGGEQDDVAIALRIALSRYIAEMHELHDSTFLIFDEIFGSQDEERRGNIFRALRALEPYFPQIFLISHVTEVQGEFGNTLVVEAVSESESRIRDLEGVEA